MTELLALTKTAEIPADFSIHPVDELLLGRALTPAPLPSLGPLAAFTGTFSGHGFNTIFRPDSKKTPTVLPFPVTGDNILELNLTTETLSFSPSLGDVPNRGNGAQPDAHLNGVPYLQSISDVTSGKPVGIHLEPGLWMAVPPTQDPSETATLVRMASIPHGATITAQGTFFTVAGGPRIDPVSITPAGVPAFPSQTAANKHTARLPQDLTSFIAAGTITQAMLDDPNTVLRNQIVGQTITSTTVIQIATAPAKPLFGGGTDNIAFLLGDPAATAPNAQATTMTAIFWIETVEHTLTIPIFTPGHPPLTIAAPAGPGRLAPSFLVNPPVKITTPRTIKVFSTQIQYTQTVILNFAGLAWPHVSVATLVPSAPVPVPASAWA